MSDSGKAVFLSYASQDAEGAQPICDALRAAGVEVWIDYDELVGGEAWDAKVRRQITGCAWCVLQEPALAPPLRSRARGVGVPVIAREAGMHAGKPGDPRDRGPAARGIGGQVVIRLRPQLQPYFTNSRTIC